MGASASVTKKMVLKIDFLNIVLKDDRRIGLLADVITLAGSIILFVAICKFTVNKFQIMETSMVIGIPIWWIGLIISLSIVALMVKVSTSILDFFIQGEKVASAP
jgi:TRAP-type C4-dicarboxylate transport system permease small subunit